MKRIGLYLIGSLLTGIWFACHPVQKEQELQDVQIAFLSDMHVQDPLLTKTMYAQLHSTRLFNENYYAFIATLDDIVKRGIRYVVISGDLTDDGQWTNARSVSSLINKYRKEHGLSFLITTGNHDIQTPYPGDYSSNDFLSQTGTSFRITSVKTSNETDTRYSPDMQTMGYTDVIHLFSDCGFLPDKNYMYWETPFTNYTYKGYRYEEALKQATDFHAAMTKDTLPVFDVSYLVEPIEGLWLVAIDANVFVPDTATGQYRNRGGYRDVLASKKYILPWLTDVAERARKNNKLLICFSHYPMTDYSSGSFSHLKKCKLNMNFDRVPSVEVSHLLADAGVEVHFAGHMHINNTGVVQTKAGNTLVNIQIPSLAAYMPGYKILTIKDKNHLNVKTIYADSIPGFDQLFPIYRKEYEALQASSVKTSWKDNILDSKSYPEFTVNHLRELVRMRFIPSDYPPFVKDSFINDTGKELADQFIRVGALPKETDLSASWTGFDYLFDFYRILNAGEYAIREIGEERMHEYRLFNSVVSKNEDQTNLGLFLRYFSQAFEALLTGYPTENFTINKQCTLHKSATFVEKGE